MEASVKLELIKTSLSIGLLAMTWTLGQRMLALWDRRKKRQEIALSLVTELQRAYGEFKAIGRLWRSFGMNKDTRKPIECPENIHWELHARAAAAESAAEAIVIKLATEYHLTLEEIEALGIFRESYQVLRRAVRDRKWFYWGSYSPEYNLFNEASVTVSKMLLRPSGEPPTTRDSQRNVWEVSQFTEDELNELARKAARHMSDLVVRRQLRS